MPSLVCCVTCAPERLENLRRAEEPVPAPHPAWPGVLPGEPGTGLGIPLRTRPRAVAIAAVPRDARCEPAGWAWGSWV